MTPLFEFALRATAILLIAGAVTLVMRRAAAASRHLVWVLAFAGLIAAPLATAMLPSWRLPVLAQVAPSPVSTVEYQTARLPTQAAVVDAPPVVNEPAAPAAPAARAAPAPSGPARDWRAVLGLVWAAGAVLTLGVLLLGLLRVWLLARAAQPVTAEAWTRVVRALSGELGVARRVTLLRAGGPAMPMTWGVGRPVILLPADADTWPETRRRQVLLHELAHVRRHDVLTQLAARLVCAAYWFHPLVWVAAAQLRVERERACDDLVLRSGARPSDYAGHLLEIARTLRVAPVAGFASVAMARPSQLALRLLDVLDAQRRRGAVTPRAALRAAIAAAVVVVPLAIVVPVGRGQGRPVTAAADLETLPVDVRARLARAPAGFLDPALPPARVASSPAATADTLKGCERGGSPRRHSSVHVNNGTAVHLTIGRCDVVFTAEGDFTFSDDFTDIATVSRGGEVVVELDDGESLRRLVVRPGPGGVLEREYRVDRETRPFDAAARAWLAETLTLMFRASGLAAPERARWILDRRGIDALVEEIVLLQGDYTRRQYYDVALGSGRLDAATIERLVLRAGQEISSDYELAELLIGLTQHQPLTAGMQAGFVTAARTIQSDYERRRVLEAALQRRDVSTQVATAMLEAAGDIGSDYELAELLIGIHRIRPMDDAVRDAFFGAANSLQSDYEHRRVLSTVVAARPLSAAMLHATLESAAGIRSDYELAELLTQVAALNVIDEKESPPYLLAAQTIQSDHEAARALAALANQRDVAPAVVRELLETAKGIQSDYELAELLIAVARAHRIDAGLQAAFDSVAATIQSRYDYDRVMAASGRRGRAELD
ncbi:MAG TPA: M56 family metallopeptidase [Gemmatimonadales bacterium]|jgi:beta-lactamase regulating signal transducer with metallopeptidase domain|nr:M56 family metallopeptidase [Gemmatimonadales bacterium]